MTPRRRRTGRAQPTPTPDHVEGPPPAEAPAPAEALPPAAVDTPADQVVGDLEAATTAALARARAAAAAKGLRPGSRPRRRRARPGDPAYGDAAYTGAGADPRDPSLLGDQLEKLRADFGWEVDLAAGSLIARWSQIVGEQVAAHATPVSFRDGALSVQASSTAWATQLRLLVPTLIGRIADEVGAGVVTSIIVLAPSAPTWVRGRRVARGPGPRDTYG
ncbi:MAG TPA: DciA family protein [Dermatophilaceae bacterium]|nr:DciA family protein [Dermatophilaceae bacterium]